MGYREEQTALCFSAACLEMIGMVKKWLWFVLSLITSFTTFVLSHLLVEFGGFLGEILIYTALGKVVNASTRTLVIFPYCLILLFQLLLHTNISRFIFQAKRSLHTSNSYVQLDISDGPQTPPKCTISLLLVYPNFFPSNAIIALNNSSKNTQR